MINHDDDQQYEPTREELLDQILPGERRLESGPEWIAESPELSADELEEQLAIDEGLAAEQGLSLAEMELYAFGDNEEDHHWDLVLDENQKPVAKPRSETTEDQREKDKRAIAELLADQPDEFLDKLRAGNKITPVNYVIQSLIPERSVGFLVGESGAKKTFAALQMAICVATGIDFAGLPIRQGSVLYFAPEDASGVRERYAGWKYKRNKNKDLENLFIIGDQVPLHNAEKLQRFAGKVLASPFFGIEENAPALVVIDTYSANSAGQKVGQTPVKDKDGKIIDWAGGQDFNENDNNVAAILMANAVKLAEMLNCAVMVVHHTGKDADRGARGASTLKANAGFEIVVKKCAKDKELFIIEHTKAKGCALLPPRAMRTQPVPLPPELVKMKREAMARMKPVRQEAQNNPAAWEIGDNLGTLVVINALEAVPTDSKDEKAADEPKRSKTEENAIRLVEFVHEYNSKRARGSKRLNKAALSDYFRNDCEPKLSRTEFHRAFEHATRKMFAIKMSGDESLTATKEAAPLLGGIRNEKPLPTDWGNTSEDVQNDGDLEGF